MPKTVAGDYEPGFTVDDARKDLNYALEMVYGMDGFSPVTAAIAEEFNLCSAAGIGDRDYAAMVEALGNVEGSSEGL
jgi:4-hydroxybutyrate dehydrogenase/sulfolactaldehyde 3-reductase